MTSFCYIVLARIIAAGTVICLITRSVQMCCEFSKEREGWKICNIFLELLKGKQVGKSHSQIVSENVQKVHILYFEKRKN